MPALCLKVFGPSTHFPPQLKLERQLWMQRVQLAIKLYERYVHNIGTGLAIALTVLMSYLLADNAEPILFLWCYCSLLVALAYGFAALNPFKKFKANIITEAEMGAQLQFNQSQSRQGSHNNMNHLMNS